MPTDLNILRQEMVAWRHHLHAHPEFGFEETGTAAFVAAKLREFGLDDVTEWTWMRSESLNGANMPIALGTRA